MTMNAIVFTASGEQLEEVAEPTPAADQVLLKVEYCGICGSDLHAGEPDFHQGTTMGHEFVGTVVEAGAEAGAWKPGDRVVVNPNGNNCGVCAQCRRGAVNLCPHLWEGAVGLTSNGGLAPYAAVPARTLRSLPDNLDFLTATWVEPLAVALRTVRRSEISVGQDAVVFGGGPIGLLVTSILAAAGANDITVFEPNPTRRAMAASQGATAVIDPTEIDPVTYFQGHSANPGFAFECSGVAELTSTAVSVLKPNGRLMVTGLSRRPPSYDPAELLFKEIEIRGSFIYRDEFDEAIALLAKGAVRVAHLTTDVVHVRDAQEAFRAMRESPTAIKYLVSAHNTEH
jgi:2-desacetyl-2-hydroxyethyl bacteriochlorophyllide A dehydrogenase